MSTSRAPEVQRHIAARLRDVGVETPDADAWRLLAAATGRTRSELILDPAPLADPATRALLDGWVARRVRREPLQHIVGTAPFMDLELAVGPGVLVPRPETERLVELVLGHLPSARRGRRPRLLDVGTGSGAVALALKAARPDLEVLGTDVSETALAWARRNARITALPVAFVRADLLEDAAVTAFARHADALVANLPYVPEADRGRVSPEVRADPPEALYSGVDGLDAARRLAGRARETLHPGAWLALELDPRNAPTMHAELAAAGWVDARLHDDLAGRTRFVLARAPSTT